MYLFLFTFHKYQLVFIHKYHLVLYKHLPKAVHSEIF